ncbi:MAG: nucleotidyltransferase family protein [Candidatus Melainabacteria bacterium]|nr:nucleotidyltransferase family protein [Candidatus Melainabacteria bacterium]
MKALILAAGIGSRLNLKDIPKPMYEIAGKPILEHNILLLKKYNVTDICVTIHHKAEVIKNYFGDGSQFSVNIKYSYEEKLLGTSGALRAVLWFLDKNPFFVIYGDNYTNINLDEMLRFHKSNKSITTVALFDKNKSLNSGIAGGVIVINKDNRIISFTEGKGSQSSGYVNAGVYIIEPKVLDMIPEQPSDFGKDIFPKLLDKGFLLKGYLTDSFVLAIDTEEALSVTESKLKEKRKS